MLLFLLLGPVPAAAATPFLWSYQNGGVTHYFAGSVHLLPEAVQMPPKLLAAAEGSLVLAFESDVAAMNQPEVQVGLLEQAQAPRGLQRDIGAPLYRRTQQALQQQGLPETMCDLFRAWFCAMTLEMLQYTRAGFQPDAGIDQQLHGLGEAQGKTLVALEELPVHLALFTEMQPAIATQMLAATLDQAVEQKDLPQEMLRLWRNNDLPAVAGLIAEMKQKHPQIYQRLLAQRNRNWLPRITQLLRANKPAMIVVGAAHYPGQDGLLALLEQRGFRLQAVD